MPSTAGRLLDTPLSESAYIGAAIGAAACGMRPVAELMFLDFMGVCFDQIFNQAAKFKYMFGGKAETPVVIRAMVGAGFRAAAQHSQMLTPLFTHIPGLKVVCPSNAYDAKGLLIQSIRDNDPVIFCEHKNLYGLEADVPAESYAIPFGEANVVRDGKHRHHRHLRHDGAPRRWMPPPRWPRRASSARSIDLRTLSPDRLGYGDRQRRGPATWFAWTKPIPRCSIASDVSAMVAQECFKALKGPIQMVTAPHTPVPFSPVLEDLYIPSAGDRKAAAVKGALMRKLEQVRNVTMTDTRIVPIVMPKWGLSMKEGKGDGLAVGRRHEDQCR